MRIILNNAIANENHSQQGAPPRSRYFPTGCGAGSPAVESQDLGDRVPIPEKNAPGPARNVQKLPASVENVGQTQKRNPPIMHVNEVAQDRLQESCSGCVSLDMRQGRRVTSSCRSMLPIRKKQSRTQACCYVNSSCVWCSSRTLE
jgi:hypothetical protein